MTMPRPRTRIIPLPDATDATTARRIGVLLVLALVAAPALATPALFELGRINGQALACGHPDVAAAVGKAVVDRVAKTRDNGAAFENATQIAFLAQGRGEEPCPTQAELTVRLQVALNALPAAAPAPEPLPSASAAAPDPEAAPNPRYLLQDMNGRAILDRDFHGRFQLVTFGYTFCPDVCPTTLAEMSSVLKQLGARADRLQPLFVSVDPARDTLPVLRNYVGFFDPRILAATASPELLKRSADSFGVRFEKVLPADGDPTFYTVDHTAGMFLLAPDGSLAARFAYATPVPELAGRIAAAMDAHPPRGAGK